MIRTMIKRVYLIEDEPMVLDFCSEYIRNYTDMEIVGASGNGHDALKGALETKPDLVVVDIRLPEVNGLEILSILKRKLPDTKVLIYTATVNPHTVRVALQGGVDGFIEKAEGLDGLRQGLEGVKQGKRYFSPHIRRMMEPFNEDLSSHAPFPRPGGPAGPVKPV
jgi:two-component system, NarL family, response regulator LiaR